MWTFCSSSSSDFSLDRHSCTFVIINWINIAHCCIFLVLVDARGVGSVDILVGAYVHGISRMGS